MEQREYDHLKKELARDQAIGGAAKGIGLGASAVIPKEKHQDIIDSLERLNCLGIRVQELKCRITGDVIPENSKNEQDSYTLAYVLNETPSIIQSLIEKIDSELSQINSALF